MKLGPFIAGAGAALLLFFLGRRSSAMNSSKLDRYAPRSPEAIALFTSAAIAAGLPASWGANVALHRVLEKESNGWVGIPNYQFGALSKPIQRVEWPKVWSAIQAGGDAWRSLLGEPWKSKPKGEQSSATGLGQLIITNLKTGKYYPSGVRGIGDANEEAIGMLKYIKERYGNPEKALAHHDLHKWY